ncbi:cell division protein ZapA [Prosthecodimorpha staleyi]|uniref:Cell division protein ZapA n=1 Tax=Prosthecodimorpha staleyi TaxID=2840188 RepID=A0A947D0R1_9HYPH|nr:cell division protein ZapA [Prosthecodimorpha staleyi]MBT9288808.1 cell division protein ZapA [Prosthecodimorpha staleyi]
MAQVNVTISGRVYRMACEDGQEDHLQGLAHRLDQTISHLRQTFGEIGDHRLTVMAAIMAIDELTETRRKAQALEGENRALKDAGAITRDHRHRLEGAVAERIDGAARRIEQLAAALTATKPVN